jgi:hypothetical protein
MRVPIFPQDLNAASGFTRLAKRLKRDWPGTQPLQLSEAQEFFARCLGYSSYQELAQSADQHPANVDYPLLEDLIINCIESICSELISDGRTKVFNLGELQAKIYRWPFVLLSVYREHYGLSDNDKGGLAIQADHVKAFMHTQKTEQEVELRRLEAHLEKVPAQLRYENQLSTVIYINFPIGRCPNSPSLKDNSALTKHIQCSSCGPYVFVTH